MANPPVTTPVTQSPKFAFTFDPSVSSFNVPLHAHLAENPDSGYSHIGTGALVFDTSEGAAPRILLIQRSSGDSMPDRWEVPGGGCDDEDESILFAVARELWEEAGLEADFIGRQVGGGRRFSSRTGKKICGFTFIVRVRRSAGVVPRVRLDPREHQRYVWATEDEVKARRAGEIELVFTHPDVEDTILKSFAYLENEDGGA